MLLRTIRNLLSASNKLTKGFLMFIVVIGIINAFFYYVSPKSPYPITTRIEDQKADVKSIIESPLFDDAEDPEAARTLFAEAMCNFMGYACHEDPDVYTDADFKQSVFGQASNILTIPYANPPASTTQFAYDTLDRIGIVPDAYAAEGLGFAGLSPLMGIWRQMRNLAFLALSVAIIISGFLIMFRTQINPQAVISIESALPKIILTMILIHFSFAIAGLMIDLMYIVTGLIVISIGPLVDPSFSLDQLVNTYIRPDAIDFTRIIAGQGAGLSGLLVFGKVIFNTLPNALINIFGNTVGLIFKAFGSILVSVYLAGPIFRVFDSLAKIIAPGGGGTVGLVVGVIVWIIGLFLALFSGILFGKFIIPFIIGCFIFFTFISLLIRLAIIFFKAYIKIIIYVALAPILIITEAIPGKGAFKNWLRNIVGELIVFPLAVAIMLTGIAIVSAVGAEPADSKLFYLPFIPKMSGENLSVLIGMGILFLIPDFILLSQKAIITQLIPVKTGPGVFFGGPVNAISSATKTASPFLSVGQYFGPARKVMEKFGAKFSS